MSLPSETTPYAAQIQLAIFGPLISRHQLPARATGVEPDHTQPAEPSKCSEIAASAMSFLQSTWRTSSSVVDSNSEDKTVPSSALNFLVAFASCNLAVTTTQRLALPKVQSKVAGIGGYSRVKVGYSKDLNLVAIKGALRPENGGSNCGTAYNHHLNQLSLELRILTHGQLRKHRNILNAVALCMDEASGVLNTSLVLEYSEIGTLRNFLVGKGPFSPAELVNFTLQVARGLESLHALRICHGDVKTANNLVFRDGDKWLIKISDFGQSIVATQGHSAADVPRPAGTPLLSAPEIRDARGGHIRAVSFRIDDAIRTDTFSFGLLAWEVLKHGECFFEPRWMNVDRDAFDVYHGEKFLCSLCDDGLLEYGQTFLRAAQLDGQELHKFSTLFRAVLRDDPRRRKSIMESVAILEADPAELPAMKVGGVFKHANADDNELIDEEELITMWSVEKSLYEVSRRFVPLRGEKQLMDHAD